MPSSWIQVMACLDSSIRQLWLWLGSGVALAGMWERGIWSGDWRGDCGEGWHAMGEAQGFRTVIGELLKLWPGPDGGAEATAVFSGLGLLLLPLLPDQARARARATTHGKWWQGEQVPVGRQALEKGKGQTWWGVRGRGLLSPPQ